MGGMSLQESQHAPKGGQPNGFAERSAYIPPHMRGQQRGPPPPGPGPAAFDGPAPGPPMGNGMNGSAWAPPK